MKKPTFLSIFQPCCCPNFKILYKCHTDVLIKPSLFMIYNKIGKFTDKPIEITSYTKIG